MSTSVQTLRVSNFQGIEEAELALGKVNLIWGRNGAGKSSLADAIYFALTGETPRGGVLADVVRQTARHSAEVEVVLGSGETILRRRSRSQGSAFVGGEELAASEVDAEVVDALGTSLPAVKAALRSGALLKLAPSELQALLGELTGAAVDRKAIAEAFEAAVSEAARRAGLALPVSLEDFALVAARAEEARRAAKRELAEREGDLSRLPESKAPGEPATRERVQADLRRLRDAREKAARKEALSAGAREERIRGLRAQLAKLSAVARPNRPDGEPSAAGDLQASLEKAEAACERTAGELAAEERRLGELRRDAESYAPADEGVAARALEVDRALEAAAQARAAAAIALKEIEAEGRQKKAVIERLPKTGCVGPCPVLPETECPVRDLSALEAKLKAARDEVAGRYRKAFEALRLADAELARMEAEDATVDAAQSRVEAHRSLSEAASRVSELQTRGAQLEGQAAQLEAKVKGARELAEAHRAWTSAQTERATVECELAKLEALSSAPEGEVVDIEAEIANAEATLEAIRHAEARDAAAAKVEEARARVVDADRVAKSCGPGGVKARLLARAAGPFVGAANAALAQLSAELRVAVSDAMELEVMRGEARLRPAQLSDGERVRLLFVLQLAVARLARFPLLVLDGAEALDETGKASLKKLAATCAREGIQVLMLSCAPAPSAVPPGVVGYVVEAGRVRRVAVAQAIEGNSASP
jgi:exonuclease SbcC